MYRVDYSDLIQQVRLLAALASDKDAEFAAAVVLTCVGSGLPLPDRERWAEHLPLELRDHLRCSAYEGVQTASEVYMRLAAAEGGGRALATEHVQAVLRVLGGALPTDVRTLIARHLPDELGSLLLSEPHAPVPAHRHAPTKHTPEGATLATGAPGSRHPVSEAQPRTGQSGSVAAWDATRMDRSLANGRAEPGPDSLATGKPGSSRSLGDKKD